MTETKQDWSTAELAEASGVCRQYVVRLLNLGTIVGHKVGRSWVVRDREAKRWLAQRKGKGG